MKLSLRSLVVLFAALTFAAGPAISADETAQPVKKNKIRDFPVETIFTRDPAQVEVVADQLEYAREQKKIIGRKNVVIRYQDVQITADYAEVETDTKIAHATGHVVIFENEAPRAHGDELTYDFNNKTGSFPDGRSLNFPWVTKGREIRQIKQGVKVVEGGSMTTCDREEPHYEIRASKMTIHDEDKLVAKNVRIYVLGKPIFWWPYLIIPLRQNQQLPFAVRVGHNSRHGTYIYLSKGISVTRQIGGKIHADYRSERGVGGGVDFDYDYGKYFRGTIQTYLTQDKRAPTPSLPNPYDEQEERVRGRVTWKSRTDLDKHSNIQLRYHRLADEFFLQDFFEDEFRSDIDPTSFATFTKNSDYHGFYTHVEKQTSGFERMVERMPEVKFNWKTQPFFNRHLFYDNEYSFSNLSKQFGRQDKDEETVRFHSINSWYLPMRWRHLKFTPFTNLGGTFYSRERESDDGKFRAFFGTGADLRTQYYRTFNVNFDKAGVVVNQLRHVMEPLVQYKTVKSSVSDETVGYFDPTDRIDDADVVTFGFENKLQTKRVIQGQMRRVDIVSLNTYLSYEIHPDGRHLPTSFHLIDDGRSASAFTVLTQEITLRPYSWLALQTRYDYDMERDKFRVFNEDIIARLKRMRFVFGYRYAGDIGDFEGSGQFVFDYSVVINPLWTVGSYFRWDPEAQGRNEWQVWASRDLHDFIFDFGYNVRDSAIAENNNRELFFSLTMKALPILGIRTGGGRASFSEPRIGDTVAGSNLTAPASPTLTSGGYDAA